MEPNDGIQLEIGADTAPLRRELQEASRLSTQFAGNLTRGFIDAAIKGRDLSEVLRSIVRSMSDRALDAAFAPINQAFGQGVGQLVGSVLPFAQGGVIASPVTFPLEGRRVGLAGEAGPEAILPLARGRDGRLGVRAEGGASQVNVTFNVTSPDAQSFKRSEGQIAAMLSRVVGRGQRNL